jgi:hypothetical protein
MSKHYLLFCELKNDQIKEDGTGRAWNTHGGEEEFIDNSGG